MSPKKEKTTMTKSTKWADGLVVLFSLIVVGLSVWWMGHTGVFNFSLHMDSQLSWHLIRSSGIVAYRGLPGEGPGPNSRRSASQLHRRSRRGHRHSRR